MNLPLSGRAALVTGGATRLGRAISLALAGAGADVAFSYNQSGPEASLTESEIAGFGRRVASLQCDVRDAVQVENLIASATAKLGPIDLLVANAGVFRRTPIETATEADWDWFMDTNAKGTFLCAQRVGLAMRSRGSGSIVVIADVPGLRPWANYVPYSASKAAVVSLTQGLAMALAPAVRVNAIAPGPVLPPADFTADELARATERTLLRRGGSARDITDAVLYLATADYVTGVVLPVDGGRHLG